MKPYYQDGAVTIYQGDCREVLKQIEAESINCCVTSPPYYGLRDFGVEGQLGLEDTPEEYVEQLVGMLREARHVLRDDGTLWLNLGDSYGTGTTAERKQGTRGIGDNTQRAQDTVPRCGGMAKQLLGIPWRVAFALQADGWYLRQDIIWHKPNPMPESVTDRCTKAHEYIFLLSKNARYWYDQEAILEPCSPNTHARLSQKVQDQIGSDRVPGKTNGNMKAVGRKFDPGRGNKNNPSFDAAMAIMPENRNKRSVWTVTTKPYPEAHFAVFPPDLILPCILAGCPKGGTVLDPFGGSGTTAMVAKEHHRKAVSIELNPEYLTLQKERIAQDILPL